MLQECAPSPYHVSFCVLVGYFLVQYLTPLGVFKSFTRKQKRSSETTVRTDTDDDWVKGTPYDLHSRKKKAAASKKAA